VDSPISVLTFYNNIINYKIKGFTIIVSEGGFLIVKTRNMRKFIEFINFNYPELRLISVSLPEKRLHLRRRPSTMIFKIRNDHPIDKKYSFLRHSMIYQYGILRYRDKQVSEVKRYILIDS